MSDSHRLAELLGALSQATDLAAGQMPECTIGATVLAVRIARAMGLDPDELVDTYYTCATRMIGCTSSASDVSPLVLGEDISLNYALNLCDLADAPGVRRTLEEFFATEANPDERGAVIDKLIELLPQLPHAAIPHCEQALALSSRLPVPINVVNLLSHLESRWDGKNPTKKGGTDVPVVARIVEFAVIAELYRRAGGVAGVVEIARIRSGGQFDPAVCSLVIENAATIFEGLGGISLWDLYLASEPGEAREVGPAETRAVAEAFADFADTKSRWFVGHSRQVASLAHAAGKRLGMQPSDRSAMFLAGLLHDIGRCGVPNGVWDKAGPLSPRERALAQTHTVHTQNILVASPAFAGLVEIACSTQERCDGTGYHRRRHLTDHHEAIVAVANVYDALTHDRPWREAKSNSAAADILLQEAASNRLPRDPVRAVLEAAGHRKKVAERVYPDGLTNREVEVLEQLARGLTTKEIASKLGVAPKTADNHVQNLYKKIGATSRTAAAMYALQHGIFTE